MTVVSLKPPMPPVAPTASPLLSAALLVLADFDLGRHDRPGSCDALLADVDRLRLALARETTPLIAAALLVVGSFDAGDDKAPDGRDDLLANVARLRRAVADELTARP